jgi:hypothetical protein
MSDKFERVRPAMRPEAPVAEESPRERAARKAAELRAHRDGTMDDGTDEFFVEPGVIPDGWTYEWKTKSILGAEDPAHQVKLARDGWEPVPASRHPEMMPSGYKELEITRKGMVLMERPAEISEEVRRAELRKARAQVQNKQAQLGEAPVVQFERSNKGDPLAKLKRSYEPIVIPDE